MPRVLSSFASLGVGEDRSFDTCQVPEGLARRRMLTSFEEKTGPDLEQACAKERLKEQDIEDESKEASADAREHAIHEAWKHAERANELSKESAEAALEAANESMEARRILDQHDIIAIENQTQVGTRTCPAALELMRRAVDERSKGERASFDLLQVREGHKGDFAAGPEKKGQTTGWNFLGSSALLALSSPQCRTVEEQSGKALLHLLR
eukprot:g28207.t1